MSFRKRMGIVRTAVTILRKGGLCIPSIHTTTSYSFAQPILITSITSMTILHNPYILITSMTTLHN